MPARSPLRPAPRRTRLLGLAVALVTGAAVLAALGAPASATPSTAGCASPVIARPETAARLSDRDPAAFGRAAARNSRSSTSLAAEARRDDRLWLDRCGRAFFVDARDPAAVTASATTTSAPATATVPLADTFTLQSRPGSARTIYLDFRGGTVTGTAWNSSYGASITVDPYSITAPADTAYSDAELTEIQKAWQVVAEDYAPFDVNVTTQDPGAAAIDRSSSTDTVFGTRVMVTAGGPIYAACSCGGIAYLNVFTTAGSNHGYYQPAFVFTNGTGTGGKYFGEAASHESGHNFGLNHDGTATSSYYSGAAPWAPIMGASYGQPVSQWSKGEYVGATTTQDDLAIIATGAPLRSDDHGDTVAGATPLTSGTPVDGLVGTRSDVDAFTFTASGATTLAVSPASGLPDLDVVLRVVDASGATVATVDPAVSRTSYAVAAGLGATWTTTLPSTPATYTAFVDGTGTGDPTTAGKYSDYGSLGNYQVLLTTEPGTTGTPPPPTTAPLTATATDPAPATVGTAWSAAPVTVTGGTPAYSFAASGVPAGLAVSASTGQVAGTPTTAGAWPVTVTVVDTTGASVSTAFTITVDPAPVAPAPALAITTTSLPSGKVGKAYAATVATSGGSPAYTWTRSGNLPPGTTLVVSSSGTSASITGTPTTRGKSTFTLTVTDGSGAAVSRAFTVNVSR